MTTSLNFLKEKGAGLRQYGIFGALVVILLLFHILNDGNMLRPNIIVSLIQQNAYVMVLAIGMVMIIIAGHIDLSVGSVVAAIGGLVGIMLSDWKLSWPLVIVVAIALGCLIGAWQGFWVAFVGVPAFIVTLAGMLIFRGVAQILVGITRSSFPRDYVQVSVGGVQGLGGYLGDLDAFTLGVGIVAILGSIYAQIRSRSNRRKHDLQVEPVALLAAKLVLIVAALGYLTYLLAMSTKGLPLVLVIVGILVLGYSFMMNRTKFGRHIYAMGGNLNAAKLSGIDTKKMNLWIFVNMGMLCGITAVIVTARAGAATAASGLGFELDAIAACFIGGAAVTGGIGRVSGAIVGALIMGVLNIGLSNAGVNPNWQFIIKGLVLLVAVAFDLINKRRSGRTG